jgi:hypothetical protein
VGDFNGACQQDVATANTGGDTWSILIYSGVVVNNFVTFDPIPSTFTFTSDPTGGCANPAKGTERELCAGLRRHRTIPRERAPEHPFRGSRCSGAIDVDR